MEAREVAEEEKNQQQPAEENAGDGAEVGEEHKPAAEPNLTEEERRREVFMPYQVNAGVMKLAGDGAGFMHCLPAHRGLEVTDEVLDSPASLVFDQAENRLHAQRALLSLLAEAWWGKG